ncbi:unnamed protein product [Phytophthora fragariaefolia]|uniref:Unnamed protein product n=1 Tax=Phytophthora fragariaefolia TaxID=1490495 RepID=A0A9W6XV08_9STRA|nr:unnamed protein product [Phytophthora fragariaefolia]
MAGAQPVWRPSPDERRETKKRKRDTEGASSIQKESTVSDDGGIQVARSIGDELPLEHVGAACRAFKEKYKDEKKGAQIGKRRTVAEPFALANYQIRIWANRYQAARNRKESVDYLHLSSTTQFKSFKDHPTELMAHEKWLLKELRVAYDEDCARQAAIQEQSDRSSSGQWIVDKTAELLRKEREINLNQMKQLLQEERELNQAAQHLAAAKAAAVSDSIKGAPVQCGHCSNASDLSEQNKKLKDELKQLRSCVSSALIDKTNYFEGKIRQQKELYDINFKKRDEELQQSKQSILNLEQCITELNKKLLVAGADAEASLKEGREINEKLQEQLAGERAITSGVKMKLAHVEKELAELKQTFEAHQLNMLKKSLNIHCNL